MRMTTAAERRNFRTEKVIIESQIVLTGTDQTSTKYI